jgi:hypothetical protein
MMPISGAGIGGQRIVLDTCSTAGEHQQPGDAERRHCMVPARE